MFLFILCGLHKGITMRNKMTDIQRMAQEILDWEVFFGLMLILLGLCGFWSLLIWIIIKTITLIQRIV